MFPEAERTLDASGRLVMPGFVDVHVHFNHAVGDVRTNDSWFEGTRAAAFAPLPWSTSRSVPG